MGAGMSAGFGDDDDVEAMSDINVTPLVDVVLVLLIMFMIIVPTMLATAPIDLELTTSATGQSKSGQDVMPLPDILPLVFSIKREAGGVALYLNGQPTNPDQLKSVFANLREIGTDPAGSLSADSDIPYDDVVRVVESLVSLGLKDLALDTQVPR